MNLSERDTVVEELMDDPACDSRRLRRTLERFSVVNRLVSKWDTTYRTHLRPVLSELADRQVGPSIRILDVGCGGGDVVHRLVRLARRDGFDVEALGIDPDASAVEVALARKPVPGVSFRNVSSSTLVQENVRFDIVISNHLLHHLNDDFDAMINDSEALAEQLCVHSDIHRSRLAYAAFAGLAAPLSPGTFVYIDGLRSIRRSYTVSELQSRLPHGWRVDRVGPFRLLAVRTYE